MKEEKRKKGKKLKFLLAAWTVAVMACMGWNRAVTAEAATEVARGNCGKDGGSNLTWTLDDEGTLTITGTGEMNGYGNVQYGYTIWAPWYGKRADINTVVVGEGVTSIGRAAFYGCISLTDIQVDDGNSNYSSEDGVLYNKEKTVLSIYPGGKSGSVSIPSGVTKIEAYAFAGNSGLTDVTIPSSVVTIGDCAFYDCSSLTDIQVDAGNSDFSSENGVLYNKWKTALEIYPSGKSGSVSIPSSVTSIGRYAFSGCSGLTNVSIPSSVTSIGYSAFSDCSGLTSVIIPSSVTSIEYSAFSGCSGLTSVTIPSGVTSIESSTFYGCSGLTSVDIPEGVTSIGWDAFYGCSGLTSVSIPEGVTSIERYAFSGCSSLTSVSIPEGVTTIGEYAFSGCSGLTSVSIPSSVTTIGERAFSGCSGLTSVSISEGVTSIGLYAFSDCSSLTSVSIPSSVARIYNFTFSDCSSLTSVSFAEGVKSIEGSAFVNCSSLTSINIPSSVTSIENSQLCWFGGCSSLIEILVDAGNSRYSSEDGVVYNKEKTTLVLCPRGKSSVSIPEGVTSIGGGAFNGCRGLTSVSIPKSVTSIGWYAFNGCRALRSVYYAGRSEEWDQIRIDIYNDGLQNATIYYTAESAEITAPAAKTLTYTGKAQVLLDAGAGEGTMQYALGSSAETAPASGWSAEIPGAVNAGTYYVWYRVARTDGSITDPACVTAVIGRASSAPGMPDTAMSVAYSVDKVGKVSLKDYSGWEWQASDRDKALTVGGKVSAVAVYSGSDKENYETVSVAVEITRSACLHDSTEVRGAEDASCTADGYTGDTYCKDCGEKVESGTAVKAAGHKWDGGKVTTEPTAEKEGVKTYTCTVCGETKTEAVPKLEDGSGEDEEKEEDKDDKKEDGRVDKEDIYLEDASGFVPGGDGADYWYENGERQGVKLKEDGTPDESYRGKEVYDPKSDEWYWLDNVQYGAVAKGKDVYQESLADDEGNIGKWVRYDESGHMVKGWDTNENGSYYFDPQYGTMLKGDQVIDGVSYHFDEITGIMTECSISLESHWETIDGADYWYENGQRQGKDTAHRNYRGKEVYDPESGAWYWLDNVDAGKKAVSKDVYQDALAGDWGDIDNGDGTRSGKWVRYDADGCMVKGWCAGKDADARTIASPEEAGDEAVYYFDLTYGTMAKGKVTIDGAEYSFDPVTGVMER